MKPLHYSDVARAIANANTPSEREAAVRLVHLYDAMPATEPASARIKLLLAALRAEAVAKEH